MTIRLLLVDDHPVFRESLTRALSTDEDLHVAGGCGSPGEAMVLIEGARPDVALVDLALADEDGYAILREVRRRRLGTSILVLTMFDPARCWPLARKSGARGLVTKFQSLTEIKRAIRIVAAGSICAPSGVIDTSISEANSGFDALSARERAVFGQIVLGLSSKQIGAQLVISTKTVETHRANINRKLGVRSGPELVLFASERGLLSPTA